VKAVIAASAFLAIAAILSGCGGGSGGVTPSDVSVPEEVIAPGVSMPMLAFGTMTMSNAGCSVSGAVEQWLRLGGRHVDMSLVYKTQPDAGKGIKDSGIPRKELFLTTKIEGPIGYNKTFEQVMSTDLAQVGVDYFDLLLMHWPCPDHKDFPNKCGAAGKEERLDTWRGLEELRRRGKARAIGVSNFNEEQVRQLTDAGYKPAVNQVQWHLGYHNDTFLEAMCLLGVKVEAWAPLAGPTKSHNIPGVSLGDPRLKAVASRYNASAAQVALRWSMAKGVTPVTATCVKDHAIADLGAGSFNLSKKDVTYLDSLQESAMEVTLV